MARIQRKTGTVTWLSLQLKCSRGTLDKYFADPMWEWGKSPFTAAQVPQIAAWIEERKTTDAGGRRAANSSLQAARARLLEAQAIAKERANAIADGKLISREEVEADAVARVLSVKNKMLELPLRAALIAGKSEMECEAIIRSWVKEICDYYANGGN
jgi:hypothetical protein